MKKNFVFGSFLSSGAGHPQGAPVQVRSGAGGGRSGDRRSQKSKSRAGDRRSQQAPIDMPLMESRGLVVVPSTLDEKGRSVEAVIASETPVARWDWDNGEYDEILLVDGMEAPANDQMPLLSNHYRYDLNCVLGSVRDLKTKGKKVFARVYFAKDEDSEKAWGKVRDGHLTDFSVGYRVINRTYIKKGESGVVGGRKFSPKVRDLAVADRWSVHETSIVPIGADPSAKARGEGGEFNQEEHVTMPGKAKRKFDEIKRGMKQETQEGGAERRGTHKGRPYSHRADAADEDEEEEEEEEEEREEDEDEDEEEVEEVKKKGRSGSAPLRRDESGGAPLQTRGAPQAGHPSGSDALRRDTRNAVRQAIQDERVRVREITEAAGEEVPEDVRTKAIEEGWSVNKARASFLPLVRGARQSPHFNVNTGGGELGANGQRDVLTWAMLHRSGAAEHQLSQFSEGSEQRKTAQELGERGMGLAGMPLISICERAIITDGGRVPQSKDEIIQRAVSGGTLAYAFTTSMNASIMNGYSSVNSNHEALIFHRDVPDFKQYEDIVVNIDAGFKPLPRGGEATHAKMDDGHEMFRIHRYAKQFEVDEQDIIDDRFDVFQDIPFEFGVQAAEMDGDLVFYLLMSNPNMQDGFALFSAEHNNLLDTALSGDNLKAAITQLKMQTDPRGRSLNLAPEKLVCATTLEWTARQLLNSQAIMISGGSSVTEQGTANTLQGAIPGGILDDARIDNGVIDPLTGTVQAGSTASWFLKAKRAGKRGLYLAHRLGAGRGVQIRKYALDKGKWGFGYDAKKDIGVGVNSYRELLKGK